MSYIKNEFFFPSGSGLCDIHAASYKPDGVTVRAVLQIAHGMAEHFERYEAFISFLCDNGIAVFVNDHVGHGKSIKNDSELGFFGTADGSWKNFVEDCRKLTLIAKEEYPDAPYFFFGHSMGSFVARSYAAKYANDITGAIFCGTAGANPAVSAGIAVAKLIAKFKGDHHRSNLINGMAFGAYNKKFEGRTPFDWLTKDTDIVDKYIADKYCGFLFTAYGYRDMFGLLGYVSSKEWYASMNKNLPVFLIAGKDDPVGNYGKGIEEVKNKLSAAGVKDVSMTLYNNCRHEILNESDTVATVESDVLKWIERYI